MNNVERVSTSLPTALVQFFEQYQADNVVKTRSEVVERADLLSREQNLIEE
jgi:metal-responsive CopG/Arc/MetJ family transcriptional regulator